MWNFPAGHMKALTRAQVEVEVVQKNPVVVVQSVLVAASVELARRRQ